MDLGRYKPAMGIYAGCRGLFQPSLAWFNQVVACGLADVNAECMEEAVGEAITVGEVIPPQ